MSAARIRTLRNPATLFGFTAVTVAAVCVAITRSRLFPSNPDLAAWGVTFDLTVTLPFLYYLIVVRRGSARLRTIAPVFAVGAALAAIVVPVNQQQFLHDLRFVAVPLELATIALIVGKIRAMRRAQPSHNGDGYETIAAAAKQIFGDTVLARAVASEVAVVWLAISGWKTNPDVPEGCTPITVHQKSGWGTVVACIVVLIAAESIGMHLLLQMWSARAAWIATALDLYAVVWLIGDYNAIRLRPSLITPDELRIRHGLRWNASIPIGKIVRIDRVATEADWRRKGVLKVALVEEPRFLIRLASSSTAHGIAGLTRQFDAIALGPDDESALSGLRCACAPAAPEA